MSQFRLLSLIGVQVICMSCGQWDARGTWTSSDVSLYVFETSDGAIHWSALNIILKEAGIAMGIPCNKLAMNQDQLVYTGDSFSATSAVRNSNDSYRLTANIDSNSITEGYEDSHRDAGIQGLVNLEFDGGLFFKTENELEFQWQANYRDDTGIISSEGGSRWFERSTFECQ